MGFGTRSGRRRARWLPVAAAGAVVLAMVAGSPAGASSGTGAAAAAGAHASRPRSPATTYYLALGDSLAAGVGASPAADGYVNLVHQHELSRFPGLQLENLSCSGATTGTMLDGGGACSYPAGSQLGEAEAFLQAHRGQVAFVTIDIGANNVDGCVSGISFDLACVQQGIATAERQLPQILAGLTRADPGVPVFGMNYYDPFLAAWLAGSSGQGLAELSIPLADQFNNDLAQIYGAAGYPTADVADAFATDDTALTGSYDGRTLPQDVANICTWTLMCTNLNIHANAAGHSIIATAFDQQIDGWFAGGEPGLVLASSGGGLYALGNALFYGALHGAHLAAPIAGVAEAPSHRGYWLAGADGGIFAFGDAGYHGSMGGHALSAPIVGMAATPDGRGYWLVAADGGIFAFGDAAFRGSMGGTPLDRPIVGMAAAPDGRGYWLVAADGGFFAFGDAFFRGSAGGLALGAPVVAMARG